MKASADEIRAIVAEVVDPELPVLTIEDLGILRDVRLRGDRAEVDITPTYSGCPAMAAISADIEAALHRSGVARVEVRTVLSPAWSTAWMSEAGRRKLREFGIAPPGPVPLPRAVLALPVIAVVRCPQCGSSDTEETSRFSSTACKALYRCHACREPFEHFKAH